MPDPTRSRSLARLTLAAAVFALAACASGAGAGRSLIVCSEIANPDLTRALFDLDSQLGRVTRFEIVTPEFLWPAPGQPETPRFAAGQSDVSPDLATHPGVRLEASFDALEQLRMVDFSALAPEALALEGLRGSLAIHEAWLGGRATGSLFYAASALPPTVVPLSCRRFAGP